MIEKIIEKNIQESFKIIQKLMEEFDFVKPIIPMYNPMHFKMEDWQYQVDTIHKSFQEYKTLSFVTGDGSFSIVPLHKENVVTTVFMRPKIGM